MNALPRKRIVGYTDRISAAPGETIRVMVSAEDVAAYDATLVRLTSGDLHPGGSGFIEREIADLGRHPGRVQAIAAGSYAIVDPAGSLAALRSLSVLAFIWPTLPGKGRQVILGQRRARSGFALALDETGAIAFEVGGATVSTGVPLLAREWAFVAATFDADARRVVVHQEPLVSYPGLDRRSWREAIVTQSLATDAPFMIAAEAGEGHPTAHFNGKIEAPVVAREALDRAGLERIAQGAITPEVAAAWDFAREMGGDRIVDRSPNRRHGRLVNLPTRAMKGHGWDGSEMNWTHAPHQYGAIHFHDDDLYDAGWAADFALTVPAETPSGVYAARLTGGGDVDHVPFVVRPPKGRRGADAVFLLPTASYLAYANERAGLEGDGHLQAFANHLVALGPGDLWLNDHQGAGLSLYDRHGDGSGVSISSRLRPILNLRPGVTSAWVGTAGTAPWQFNADLPLLDWLAAKGIACDVVTDEDLDREGMGLLDGYRVMLTGSHPEYWSRSMYDALQAYLGRGGRMMYLGGNGFYWRVAFHPTLPGVIELRRAEDGIRDWVAEGGEYYMSFTGEYGGMWCRMGRSIHALAGVGMAGQGFDVSTYYRRNSASRDPRAAFVFEGVEGDVIGDFGTVGGGAAGLEVDRYDRALGSPPHALVLASSENLSDTYFPPPDEINNASAMMDARQNTRVRADLVLFTTPNGGAVFSTGSIAWIGSLTHNRYDNNVSRITENVLRRFLDTKGIG
ncbi:MAG: large subunit of N,N-dimethylformamidase [Alphaproteobacteria bacterium]|nr:large subunit of N,N-dimethylformamidase [Alphaproteobacteria bacterium]